MSNNLRCNCEAFPLVVPVLGKLVGYTSEGVTHTVKACGKQVITFKPSKDGVSI